MAALSFARQATKVAMIFIAGVFVGAGSLFLWLSSQFEGAQKFVSLAARAQLQEEAFKQYQAGERHVAIYALNRALQEQEEYVRESNGAARLFWDLGLLHARLAKVHSQIGDKSKAELHAARATEAFSQFGWRLRTADELWGALELIDNRKLTEAVERYGVKER
jgi:hypothetical protein